jgi:DNA-directed RNA polymerase omega subunit
MSSNKYHSRHSEFNKETCVKNAGGNQFDLIIMASQRAREIKMGNSHSNKMEHHHGVMTALLEIQSGKVEENWEHKIR